MTDKNTISKFDNDVLEFGGYKYTGEKLSCKLAQNRYTKACFEAVDFNNKTVIDAGCGDGTYTREIIEKANPLKIIAFDPCTEAIKKAKEIDNSKISEYINCSVEDFQLNDNEKYDILVYRSMLHHLDSPDFAIEKARSIAKQVIIIEPNGESPILKLIEKFSKYHIEHNEKSYGFKVLKKCIENAGGRVTYHKRVCCVPCFCPDFLAKIIAAIEPLIEKLPYISKIFCSTDVIVYE